MSKSNEKPLDRATPRINAPTKTDVQKVSVTRDLSTTAKASPSWASALALQGAVQGWNNAADQIEQTAGSAAALRSQLKVLSGKLRVARRTWSAAKKQVISTLEVQCAGSADALKAFGFDAFERVVGTGPIAAPDHLATAAGKLSGQVVVSWPMGSARFGFLLQHARDLANTATYSEVIVSTRTKKLVTGFQPGEHVFVRVAAVDPSVPAGHSPWSTWVAATAR